MTRIRLVLANALAMAVAQAALAQDTTLPMISSVQPAPGATVTSLTNIAVTFSEPVVGVDAAALLVNGAPALAVTNQANTFFFAVVPPAPGAVAVRLAQDHGIVDLAGNGLNENAAGHQWSYTFVDITPPGLAWLAPPPNARLSRMEGLEVQFNEPVTGVEAADLLVNGLPAASVSGVGAGPYVFRFEHPPLGTVRLAWAPDHGIADLRSNLL